MIRLVKTWQGGINSQKVLYENMKQLIYISPSNIFKDIFYEIDQKDNAILVTGMNRLTMSTTEIFSKAP